MFDLALWLTLFSVCRWFYPGLSRQRAEILLRQDGREGVFLVRESQQKDVYTVAIYTREGGEDGTIRHYHVKKKDGGCIMCGE